jgi:hypothetical protein
MAVCIHAYSRAYGASRWEEARDLWPEKSTVDTHMSYYYTIIYILPYTCIYTYTYVNVYMHADICTIEGEGVQVTSLVRGKKTWFL